MIAKKAMLIDITLCVGCNACQVACKEENGLSDKEEQILSPTAYTVLHEFNGTYVRRMCQHCVDPTCVSVCPVGAFTKTAAGPVLYDENKCIGCRYCMQACPFQVPRYEWDNNYPRVQKCKFCASRLEKGLQPACAEACPTGATKFGDRDDLIREAHERIKAEPEKYVNKVYGLEEVGGTSILYISSVPFEELGFKTNLSKIPLPALTWNALSKIPTVVAVGGVFLYGVWWITNRRTEVQQLEAKLREMDDRSNGHETSNS
ncbi:MAG: 4Fe-4S dicluster domain-containing protein [Ignavibacteriales bacterium]|nr:4Fe-4S dicluster domain-containing protein [Ignavibacteriales bacterium]